MFGKVNFKGGLTGGWLTLFTTHLASVGVVAARQGYAYAANAPLTGFHSGSELEAGL